MDTETLLKPRYKVIADYPGNDNEVGHIWDFNGVGHRTEYLDTMPHLFRKLQWWEERTIEQLESVKFVRIETYRGYWRVGDIVPVKKFVYGSLDKAQPTGYLLEGNHYQPIFELIPEYQKQPQKPCK